MKQSRWLLVRKVRFEPPGDFSNTWQIAALIRVKLGSPTWDLSLQKPLWSPELVESTGSPIHVVNIRKNVDVVIQSARLLFSRVLVGGGNRSANRFAVDEVHQVEVTAGNLSIVTTRNRLCDANISGLDLVEKLELAKHVVCRS